MDRPPCWNCRPGEEAMCDCPCHEMEAELAEMFARLQQRAMGPVSLGTPAFFTQLVFPGMGFQPDVPWSCWAPMVSLLCTTRGTRMLTLNVFN